MARRVEADDHVSQKNRALEAPHICVGGEEEGGMVNPEGKKHLWKCGRARREGCAGGGAE